MRKVSEIDDMLEKGRRATDRAEEELRREGRILLAVVGVSILIQVGVFLWVVL